MTKPPKTPKDPARPTRAKAAVEEMARKLLANTVIESFRVEIA